MTPAVIDLRSTRKQEREVARVLRCARCRCRLVKTESGWFACYWLCDKLKSRWEMVRRLSSIGLSDRLAEYELDLLESTAP